MSLTVAPTVSRGPTPLLQPFYYTSSLFVEPMREDITALLSAFVAAYGSQHPEPQKPFGLFKSVWKAEGWELVHLKVLDMRARARFLPTVMRLLAERMEPVEHPLIRVGALFGLYTFYMIQPAYPEASVRTVGYIPLTIDSYEQLMALPDAAQPSLRMHVIHILSELLSLQVFHILPNSSLGAQDPRNLPHTMPLLTQDITHGHKKKTGRPSQVTQSQRADKALSALEAFVEQKTKPLNSETSSDSSIVTQAHPSPDHYILLKERFRSSVPEKTLKAAETLTMDRIRDAEQHVTDKNLPLGDREALERLKDMSTQPEGLLGLLQRDRG